MADDLTGLLVSTAEMSNLVSFLTVICGLMVMFVFLVRLICQDIADGGSGGVTNVTQATPQVEMVKVRNPFVLKFSPSQTPSSSVRISLGCSVPYYARVYWGVNINTFHHVLHAPWPWFREAFLHGKLFGAHCLEYGRSLQDRARHGEREEEIKRKRELELGPAPRTTFPLVLVFVAKDCEEEAGAVAGMLAVIHLRDSVCSVPSQVLATYLRRGQGEGEGVVHLKQLYLPQQEADSDTEPDTQPGAEGGGSLCVVCQLERVSRVNLPCRHAVTCRMCFVRCKNSCPMCRAHVSSFFLIGPETPESPVPDKEAAAASQPTSLLDRLWHFNRRLNLGVGIQEN